MGKKVKWKVLGEVSDKDLKDYMELQAEMIKAVKEESLVDVYDWYNSLHKYGIESNFTKVETYEEYESEEIALEHLATWNKFSSRYTQLVRNIEFVVYSGELGDELKKALSDIDLFPEYYEKTGSGGM